MRRSDRGGARLCRRAIFDIILHMTLYGLTGFTHSGARILTLMSPQGRAVVAEHVRPGTDVIAYADAGMLPRYQEKRSGALARLVADYDIIVLSKPQWDRMKAALGDRIWG